MSTPTPTATRRQVPVALGIRTGTVAIASYSRSSLGDGRIRLAMLYTPGSKLGLLTNDDPKFVRWLCAGSLTTSSADGDAQELLTISWERRGETI